MSAEVTGTAHLEIKADTKQAIREVEKLRDTLRKSAYAATDSGSSFGKMIDSLATGFAKFNLAVGGVTTAIGMLKSGLAMAREIEGLKALERALPTGAINVLTRATHSMISEADTLRLGVRGMTGAFAITETQMAKVLEASVALEQRGFGPAAAAAEKFLKAIAKGEFQELKEFGVNIVKTTDSAQNLKNTITELDKVISESSGITERQRNLADLDRTLDDVGKTTKTMVASVVGAIASLVHSWGEAKQSFDRVNGKTGTAAMYPGQGFGLGGNDDVFAPNMAAPDLTDAEMRAQWREIQRRKREAFAAQAANVGQSEEEQLYSQLGLMDWQIVERERKRAIIASNRRWDDKHQKPWVLDKYADVGEHEVRNWTPDTGFGETTGSYELEYLEQYQNSYNGTDGGFGSAPFDSGPLEDLEAEQKQPGYMPEDVKKVAKNLQDTSKATGQAFAVMSGGITAGVEAAISGSESIGQAAAKASAAVLKALAIEATGRAIYEGALALGSLAIGRPDQATIHGLAAAKYAGAAVAMGALAAGLGAAASGGGSGGGASSSAGGGYASPGGGVGGSGGSGGINVTINLGDGFVGDEAKLADYVGKAVREAQRRGQRENYATSYSG